MEITNILLINILILQVVVIYLELKRLSSLRGGYKRWDEANKKSLEQWEADRAEYIADRAEDIKDRKEWQDAIAKYDKERQEWEAERAEYVKDMQEWRGIKESLVRFLDNVERRSDSE